MRTALIVAAVAISAALIVAVSTSINSAQQNFQSELERFLGATDARIIHQFSSRFDASLLDTVRSWPEVRNATGRLSGSLTLVRADERRDPETGRPLRVTVTALGVDFEREFDFRRIEMKEQHGTPSAEYRGGDPRSPALASQHSIIIDPITASTLQAKPGDVLHVQRFGDPVELTVAGIYERQRLGTLQRPQIFIDRDLLGSTINREGELTSIAIILRNHENVDAFCRRYQPQLPEKYADVLSLEPAEMARSGFDRRIAASRLGLIIASMLTFLCAGFIIVTGLTTAVTERQRELAIVRCIGGTRTQLFTSQISVGLLFAVKGGLIGVPLGILLASLLLWWFRDVVEIPLVLSHFGVMLAVFGSLGAGLLGGAYPAWLAARVSPLRALQRQADPVRWLRVVVCGVAGVMLLGVQAMLMLPGIVPDVQLRFWMYAWAGLSAVHVGYFLIAVPMLVVVAALLTPAIARLFSLPATLLRRSVLATPYRHGFTAGALMVGISIMVSTWSNGLSLLDDWIGRMKFADGFAFRTTGIGPDQQQAIIELPFVEQYVLIGYMPVRIVGQQVFGVEGVSPPNVICIGFDPEVFFEINTVEWVQTIPGGPQRAIARLLEGDAVIVAEQFLTARNIGVGDTLRLGAPGQTSSEHGIAFEIVGVVESVGLDIATQLFGIRSAYMEQAVSTVFLDFDAVQRHFDNRDVVVIQINMAEDVTDEEATEQIAAVAPGVTFRSGRWIRETIDAVAATALAMYSAIAFAALVLASFGAANVIIANIRSRSFEYGVVRAIGGHRSVLLRLILGEAVILAMTGAVVGTLLGLHTAYVSTLFYRDLAGIELRVIVPIRPLMAGVSVLLILVLLAALIPALRLMHRRPITLLATHRNG